MQTCNAEWSRHQRREPQTAVSERRVAAIRLALRLLPEDELQLTQALELSVHVHELVEEALDLGSDPDELFGPHLGDGGLDLFRQLEELRNALHPVAGDAAIELAIVPNDVFGLASHLFQHVS